MSLYSYIEKLKAKPEHIRKRYAFSVSFGLTAIIFLFWLASFSSFGKTSSKALTMTVEKVSTPAQSLVAGVGSVFTDLKDLIFGPKKMTYSSVLVSPGKK